MSKVLFRNRINYSRWLVIGAVVALVVFSLGFVTGEIAPLFYVIGGMWLMVIAVVALIIHAAGSGQVAQLAQEGPTIVIEANGLLGRGMPRVMPLPEVANWRWLTQASNSRQIGPKLAMLAFDYSRKTYRLPLSTAQAADMDGLRALAPEAVEALVAQFPALKSLPLP